jgi:hypothetical protein
LQPGVLRFKLKDFWYDGANRIGGTNNMELEYTGRPLSAIMSLPNTPHWLYIALWSPLTLPYNAESIDYLIGQGWKQSPIPYGSTILESQLYQNAQLVNHDTQTLLYFYRTDQDERPPVPVVLAFAIDNLGSQPAREALYIPMLNPFPLPQYGEYAYVAESPDQEKMVSYHVLSLPLAARQRWALLGDKLRAISAPSMWPAFTQRHDLASNEAAYQQAIQSLQTRQKLAIGETRAGLIVEDAQLRAAHQHIAKLRETLRKPWRDAWQKIQILARDLARDYYQHHLSLHPVEIVTDQATQTPETATIESEQEKEVITQRALFAEEVPETPVEKRKRGRRPAQSKPRAIARRNDYTSVPANRFEHSIGRTLLSQDNFTNYPDAKIARHIENIGKEKGQLIIDIGNGTEAWQTINDALNTLGDSVADIFYASLALATERNGIEHISDPFLTSPDELLEMCCKEKSKGSYTQTQRIEVTKALKTLSLAHVKATIAVERPAGKNRRGRPKRGETRANGETYIKMEGNLIDLLSFTIGEYSAITGDELWEKRSISIGTWAKTMPGLSPSTARMLRKLLKYSGKNDRYKKRIGIYLTYMFRYNAQRGGRFLNGITIATLLERSGIVITQYAQKNPGEFKESIERALASLKEEEVIGDYWEIIDATPATAEINKEIRERAYGWLDLWLQKTLNFEPPSEVKNHYQKLLKESKEAPASGINDELIIPE